MLTPLTTVPNMQIVMGIRSTDTAQSTLLAREIQQASKAICNYCNRPDFGVQYYQRILSGNNAASIAVPDVPIQELTLNGNTNSTTTISGLPTAVDSLGAGNLFVNQSVFGPGIPQGTYITNVTGAASSGSITISQAATATASNVPIQFGIALLYDDSAFGGSAFGAFSPATPTDTSSGALLQEGIDYYLDYDDGPGGPCSSGLIYRLGYYWFKPDVWVWGLVTPQTGPPIKNIMVQYLAGYTEIPLDVQDACELMVARKRGVRKFGAGVQSLSQGDMSVSLSSPGKLETGLFTAEIRSLLAPYRLDPMPNPA